MLTGVLLVMIASMDDGSDSYKKSSAGPPGL